MQQEIDQESEHRAELARLEKSVADERQRALIRAKIDKSDDKIQSLAVLMLHYCSGAYITFNLNCVFEIWYLLSESKSKSFFFRLYIGLQHCLDQDTDQSASSFQPDSSIQSQTGLDLDQSEATVLSLNQSEPSFLGPVDSTENLGQFHYSIYFLIIWIQKMKPKMKFFKWKLWKEINIFPLIFWYGSVILNHICYLFV